VLSITATRAEIEADLAAGRLWCPGCDGPLRAWGHARERQIRTRHGTRSLRPRRACCGACDATHVLLPASLVPRRRDSAEVIGAALLANAHGDGHRTTSSAHRPSCRHRPRVAARVQATRTRDHPMRLRVGADAGQHLAAGSRALLGGR
jgi:hypothetical protein